VDKRFGWIPAGGTNMSKIASDHYFLVAKRFTSGMLFCFVYDIVPASDSDVVSLGGAYKKWWTESEKKDAKRDTKQDTVSKTTEQKEKGTDETAAAKRLKQKFQTNQNKEKQGQTVPHTLQDEFMYESPSRFSQTPAPSPSSSPSLSSTTSHSTDIASSAHAPSTDKDMADFLSKEQQFYYVPRVWNHPLTLEFKSTDLRTGAQADLHMLVLQRRAEADYQARVDALVEIDKQTLAVLKERREELKRMFREDARQSLFYVQEVAKVNMFEEAISTYNVEVSVKRGLFNTINLVIMLSSLTSRTWLNSST